MNDIYQQIRTLRRALEAQPLDSAMIRAIAALDAIHLRFHPFMAEKIPTDEERQLRPADMTVHPEGCQCDVCKTSTVVEKQLP